MENAGNGRGRLERQNGLVTPPAAVAVVGVGGVGSWVANLLGMAGVQRLYLFDSDTLSATNRNRILTAPNAVGKRKSDVIAGILTAAYPESDIFAFGEFNPAQAKMLALQEKVKWVIATTDTLASRRMVSQWAFEHGVAYIEAAAEGEFGSVTDRPAEWATPDEEKPGYASVPVWAGPCVFAAALAVQHVLHNTLPTDGHVIRLGWQNQRFSHFEG